MCDLPKDYGDSDLDVQYAILDHFRRFPDKSRRPDHILWNGVAVKTADQMDVPTNGLVRAELLSSKGDAEQDFDLKVDGWIQLRDGTRVKLLRTWNDPAYVPAVEYPYHSEDGKLWVWNVFRRPDGRGHSIEEKWTGNAGLWIEELGPLDRIYHASHGLLARPDFEALVFRITARPRR